MMMKIAIAGLLLPLGLMASAVYGNLLENAGFERGDLSGWVVPAGYPPWTTIEAPQDAVVSGIFAVKKCAPVGQSPGFYGMRQTIRTNVPSGAAYYSSMQVRSESGAQVSESAGYLRFIFFNAAAQRLQTITKYVTSPSTNYQEIVIGVTNTFGTNAVSIDVAGMVRVYPDPATNDCWSFDNFVLVPIGNAPQFTLTVPEQGTCSILAGATQIFEVAAMDFQGDTLTYHWLIQGAPAGSGTTTCPLPVAWGEIGSNFTIQCWVSDGVSSNAVSWFATAVLGDRDRDGIPDSYELTNSFLDVWNPADAGLDQDNDSLNNLAEYQSGADPNNPDTDGDGAIDGMEALAGTIPIEAASVFQLESVEGASTAQVQIVFSSVHHRTYEVQAGSDPSSEDGWTNILLSLQAGTSIQTNTLALGNPSRAFLRVRVLPPAPFVTLNRQLRVDLLWPGVSNTLYVVQRATAEEGPFSTIKTNAMEPAFSDFIGTAGTTYYYRVRAAADTNAAWSEVRAGTPQPYDQATLLEEVQEASFRYSYNYAHPNCGLTREWALSGNPHTIAVGGSGMSLFNLVAGVRRDFISRPAAAARVLKMLRFLYHEADRFHGAFPHWLDGGTGKVIPFSSNDDGADLVETAFLAQGALLVREFFDQDNPAETEIRTLAHSIWEEIEWDWFRKDDAGKSYLLWHWSPNYGFEKDLEIIGFNECQIVYLLAMASPTHPVPSTCYDTGWFGPKYGTNRTAYGVPLQLYKDLGPPLFFTHYSYLGFDPREITYSNITYFSHFQSFCEVQVAYARDVSGTYAGYDTMWGLTASRNPWGYSAHAPGPADNGTIAPTAALSSMPYLPDDAIACMTNMYLLHGDALWGPYGFYDAFNMNEDWVSGNYIGIDAVPICAMIENYRSGLLWSIFMQAPEIQALLGDL